MIAKKTICVIPARYSSTRLPGKPLIPVKGLPLIMWAYNGAKDAGVFSEVCVATDDERIHETVIQHGGVSCLTSAAHESGTDRVFEVASNKSFQYIVNLQGDEPCVPKNLLKQFSENLEKLDDNSLLTCVSHATIDGDNDPNVVKAVLTAKDEALYFSRSSIPFDRDGARRPVLLHWGIYGFTAQSLARFCRFLPGTLEKREKLEQLRALENGMRIICMRTDHRSCGIDTPDDMAAFKKRIEG